MDGVITNNDELLHYANMPIQYAAIFHGCKNLKKWIKIRYFLIFAQNIDCGYTLESPH